MASATLLAGAAGVLFGWRPDDFWAATPAELAALVRAARGDAAVEPVDLASLIERFPDE